MMQTLLLSQPADKYLAVGIEGTPITQFARQLDSVLRMRQLDEIADCFAQPRTRHQGTRIEWVYDHTSDIIPWQQASREQRQYLIETLIDYSGQLQALYQTLMTLSQPSAKLVAKCLQLMICFPAPEMLFLVNHKPVITFWGYYDPQGKSCDLREIAEQLSPLNSVNSVINAGAGKTEVIIPVLHDKAIISESINDDAVANKEDKENDKANKEDKNENADPTVAQDHPPLGKIKGHPLLSVFICLFTAGMVCFTTYQLILAIQHQRSVQITEQSNQPVITPNNTTTHTDTQQAPDNVRQDLTYALPNKIQLPLKPASLKPVTSETSQTQTLTALKAESKQANLVTTSQKRAHQLKTIQIPETAMRTGNINFAWGQWRTQLKFANQAPITLKFSFSKQHANVIWQQDKRRCTTQSEIGFLPSGNLSIRSRTRARCNQGTSQAIPVILCRLTQGVTQCHYEISGTHPVMGNLQLHSVK